MDHPTLFNDVPSKTNVLVHKLDVADHKPIKQHAYLVHPTKHAIMRKEVQYLLDHDFTVASS